jgi:malonate decarboxylase gamma subunit
MTDAIPGAGRGATWFSRLTDGAAPVPGGPPSLRVADAALGDDVARFLAIVPDPSARFPRARQGEVGVEEGWALARSIRECMHAASSPSPPGERTACSSSPSPPGGRGRGEGAALPPIIAIVDVPSQAYGRLEELLGIHLACAAAVDAYASARLAGHPVVALLVGRAMSGAFLAHGYQASRVLALDDPGVVVHAMGKAAAARVTRRSVAELDELGGKVLPMSYDVRDFARLGVVDWLIGGVNADAPTAADVARVRRELVTAVRSARRGPTDLGRRLESDGARQVRAATIEVRRRLAEQWDAP